MRINGFRCDACTKEHLFDHTSIEPTYVLLPPGWFMVARGPYRQSDEAPLFCSARCLAAWAEKQWLSTPDTPASQFKETIGAEFFFDAAQPIDHEKMKKIVASMHPHPRISEVKERRPKISSAAIDYTDEDEWS